MITPIVPCLSRISRAASRPSISGIRISIKAMSGSSFDTRSSSSLPLDASPTTSMPSAMSRYLRSPCLTSDWSSAMATLIVTAPPVGCVLGTSYPGLRRGFAKRCRPGGNASEEVSPVDEEQGRQGPAGGEHSRHQDRGQLPPETDARESPERGEDDRRE